jgi:metal-responsive CopG/Arc/MetJ family transcriptional regulator
MAKVNISLPDEILEEVDNKRKEKKINRSEFLRRAATTYLHVLEDEKAEEEKKKGIEKAIELQDEIRSKIGKWDAIETLRKFRESRR